LQSYIVYLRDITTPGEPLPDKIVSDYNHLRFAETYKSWGPLRRWTHRAVRCVRRWFEATKYDAPGEKCQSE